MASNTDTFSLDGATRLANKIRRFWRAKGHSVLVWVEEVPAGTSHRDFAHRDGVYQVRSNLVNGLPRAAAIKIAA